MAKDNSLPTPTDLDILLAALAEHLAEDVSSRPTSDASPSFVLSPPDSESFIVIEPKRRRFAPGEDDVAGETDRPRVPFDAVSVTARFRKRIARTIEKFEAEGREVPQSMRAMLEGMDASLARAGGAADAVDPDTWVDALVNDASRGAANSSEHLHSFRGRDRIALSPHDADILASLSSELDSEEE